MPLDKIHIGTSGWNYEHWVGSFYPEDTGKGELLRRYAERFASVEVNNSFYQLPDENTVENWVRSTPVNFRFSVKASRYITHMKKLRDPEDAFSELMDTVDGFGGKLGPILFQLPPNWKVNTRRLQDFLGMLPRSYRYAFEFRDRSWLCDEVYALLRENAAALCFYDFEGFHSPEEPTADFIYLRLHGPNEKAYTGSYDGRTLAGYAAKILRWRDEGKEVFCYFDNDEGGNAPRDALRLMESIDKQA